MRLDFDGDTDVDEGIRDEIAEISSRLMAALMTYAADVAETPLVFDAEAYPYFFVDTDGDGVAGGDEAIYPNRYDAWTPRLLRAAYNYLLVAKDGGAYVHNPTYTLQILHDSLADVGIAISLDLGELQRP